MPATVPAAAMKSVREGESMASPSLGGPRSATRRTAYYTSQDKRDAVASAGPASGLARHQDAPRPIPSPPSSPPPSRHGGKGAWNAAGAATTAQLYTPDAVLVGAATGIGQAEIARLLGLLYAQGWTRIAITVTNARPVGAVVLAVFAFTAYGTGPAAAKVLHGKSSHVLTRVRDTWLSAMHTAA